MRKSALILLITLLPLTANAQSSYNNEDGKKIDKDKLETKDYLPEVHGTIRAKYEHQTTMGAIDIHENKLQDLHYGLRDDTIVSKAAPAMNHVLQQ